MNKKAMLLASETLKMILAIIAIGFLVFLLTSLYFSNTNSKNLVEATSTIERISDVIIRLQAGEIQIETITTLTPAGWTFFSFTESEVKPNFCAGQNCLCICDEVWSEYGGLFGERQVSECDESGTCLIISKLKEFEEFEIGEADNPTDIEISTDGVWLEVNKK